VAENMKKLQVFCWLLEDRCKRRFFVQIQGQRKI